jgi:hypothetical protein
MAKRSRGVCGILVALRQRSIQISSNKSKRSRVRQFLGGSVMGKLTAQAFIINLVLLTFAVHQTKRAWRLL